MSSIQPSATTELPSTPPLSEETLANADGEPPTLSTISDQSIIESSSVASPDLELSDFFGKVYSYWIRDSMLTGCSSGGVMGSYIGMCYSNIA
jgi:hypothetical protein